MPRHPRPRSLSDAELLELLVEDCVAYMLNEGGGSRWTMMLWRELRRRRLVRPNHRPACVCSECIEEWQEGIHDHPTPEF